MSAQQQMNSYLNMVQKNAMKKQKTIQIVDSDKKQKDEIVSQDSANTSKKTKLSFTDKKNITTQK